MGSHPTFSAGHAARLIGGHVVPRLGRKPGRGVIQIDHRHAHGVPACKRGGSIRAGHVGSDGSMQVRGRMQVWGCSASLRCHAREGVVHWALADVFHDALVERAF